MATISNASWVGDRLGLAFLGAACVAILDARGLLCAAAPDTAEYSDTANVAYDTLMEYHLPPQWRFACSVQKIVWWAYRIYSKSPPLPPRHAWWIGHEYWPEDVKPKYLEPGFYDDRYTGSSMYDPSWSWNRKQPLTP